MLQELLKICLQIAAVLLAEVRKLKRLKIALRGPHGKKHSSLCAHCAAAHMEDHFHLDSLIQRLFQVQQSSCDRELVQLASGLTSIFQTNQGKDCACEFDARGTRCRFYCQSFAHMLPSTIPFQGLAREITKELGLFPHQIRIRGRGKLALTVSLLNEFQNGTTALPGNARFITAVTLRRCRCAISSGI